MFNVWLDALIGFLTIQNILVILIGTIFGIFAGAMPGLGSTMSLAIAIPFTFTMDPATALILLGALYTSSVYAGSISAILLKTPGTASAAATIADGYALTEKGMSTKALGMSAIASSFGGIFSVIILATMAPFLAEQSLKFGPSEYFALSVFGLMIISSLSGKNIWKGLLVGVLGVLISTIGMDPIQGIPRFIFDKPQLLGGVGLVPSLIGLFSVSQAFYLMIGSKNSPSDGIIIPKIKDDILPTLKEVTQQLPNMLRSSIIGTGIGIIPGIGTDVGAFIAYNEAQRWSRKKDEFGKGSLYGVAAPESANNAVTGGTLVPLLTLSIPGNAVAAVFLGGLLIHGLKPGMELFTTHSDIMHMLFISLIFSNLLILFFGIYGIKYFSKVVTVKPIFLGPIILIISIVGSFAIGNNYYDIWVMLAFGVLGYFLRRYNFPITPIVLAIILSPIAEANFNKSLIISKGDWTIFFTRPITVTFLILSIITFIAPFIFNKKT